MQSVLEVIKLHQCCLILLSDLTRCCQTRIFMGSATDYGLKDIILMMGSGMLYFINVLLFVFTTVAQFY